MSQWNKILGRICDRCPLCAHARSNPETTLGRLMQWHGKWCPAWQAQIKWAEEELKKRQYPSNS